MKTITRKTMLYKTGVEYGDYTMNHALGCSHGCKYPCYAFLMKKRFGQVKDYAEWCEPKIVVNTLPLLEKEIPRLKDKIKSVFLSFSTDPFMYGNAEMATLSIAAIGELNSAGLKCTVLTKGLLPECLADTRVYSPENEYGISLVSLDEEYRLRMEPHTAPYDERLARLKYFHEAGCKTWVSMEPYPTPNLIEQDLTAILEAVSFVNKIIFGRTNYSKEVNGYPKHKAFYNECAELVKDFCRSRNIDCRIKKGTLT